MSRGLSSPRRTVTKLLLRIAGTRGGRREWFTQPLRSPGGGLLVPSFLLALMLLVLEILGCACEGPGMLQVWRRGERIR